MRIARWTLTGIRTSPTASQTKMGFFELVLSGKTDILDNKTKDLHTKCFPKHREG